MKKSFILATALLLAAFLTGCTTAFTRLSPPVKVPENDSGIYTFTVQYKSFPSGLVHDSVRVDLVINGQAHEMTREGNGHTFTYDYRMPPNLREARYYYQVSYDYKTSSSNGHQDDYSARDEDGLHLMRIINRYPIQLITSRGPVGASVTLVGRGFTEFDKIVIGDQETATVADSPTSLRFTVPALPANQTYDVKLRTGQGDLPAGTFRIDAALLRVLPERLNLTTGGRELLVLSIDFEAPEGGLTVKDTTDVASSLIMPEIVIPAGSRTVSVPVEAGQPGSGTLYLEADGFEKVAVPVTVR